MADDLEGLDPITGVPEAVEAPEAVTPLVEPEPEPRVVVEPAPPSPPATRMRSALPPQARNAILGVHLEDGTPLDVLLKEYRELGPDGFNKKYRPDMVDYARIRGRLKARLREFAGGGPGERELYEVVEALGLPSEYEGAVQEGLKTLKQVSHDMTRIYGLGDPGEMVGLAEVEDDAGFFRKAWTALKAFPLSVSVMRGGFESFAGLSSAREEEELIQAYDAWQKTQQGDGFLEEVALNVVGAIPDFALDLTIQGLGAVVGAGIGASAGGGAGSAAGPAGAAVGGGGGAVAGAVAGRTVADATWTYVNYAGIMWAGVLAEADRQGLALDRATARRYVHAAAVSLTAMTTLGVGELLKKAPGVKRLFDTLIQQNVRKAVEVAGKKGASIALPAAAMGAAVGGIQAAAQAAAVEAGTGVEQEADVILAAATSAITFGLVGAMGNAAAGGLARIAEAAGANTRARLVQERAAALPEIVKRSELLQKNPDVVKELSAAIVGEGHLFVRRVDFENAAVAAGMTPDELYKSLTGRRLDPSLEGDIPVGASELAKIVSREEFSSLASSITAADGGPTVREMIANNEELLAKVEEARGDPESFIAETPEQEVSAFSKGYKRKALYERLLGKFADAGVPSEQAQAGAAVLVASLEANAKNANDYFKAKGIDRRVDPTDLLDQMLGDIKVEVAGAKRVGEGDAVATERGFVLEQTKKPKRKKGIVRVDLGKEPEAREYVVSKETSSPTEVNSLRRMTSESKEWGFKGIPLLREPGEAYRFTKPGKGESMVTVELDSTVLDRMLETQERIGFMADEVQDRILGAEIPGPLGEKGYLGVAKLRGMEFYRYLSEQLGGEDAANQWLLEHGIRGLRHTSKQDHSRPLYVVFDRADLEVIGERDVPADLEAVRRAEELKYKLHREIALGQIENSGDPELVKKAKELVEHIDKKLSELGSEEWKPELPSVEPTLTGAETPRAIEERKLRLEKERQGLDPDEEIEPVLEQRGRGEIEIGGPGSGIRISLTAPDKTTFLHEVGHAIITLTHRAVMEIPDSPLGVEYGKILRWMGYKDAQEREAALARLRELQAKERLTADESKELSRILSAEERFGFGFEEFLAGRADPPPSLASVFRRFRNWVVEVYRGISGLRDAYRESYGQELELSPAVADAIEAMLVADASAKEAENSTPLLTELKLSAEGPRAEEYRALREAAAAEAESGILAKIYADIEDKHADAYGVTSELRAEAKAEVESRPHRVAMRAVRDGTIPKVDIETVPEQYRDALRRRGVASKRGKISLEALASYVDAKPEELARAIATAPKMQEEVAARHLELIKSRFPSLADDEVEVIQAADRAFANSATLRRAFIELKDIEEAGDIKGRSGMALVVSARQSIRNELRDAPHSTVVPESYMKAAARLRAESHEAVARGDWQKAAEAKRAEILALAKATEARAILEEAKRLKASIRKFRDDEFRGKLGRVKGSVDAPEVAPYLDMADNLLYALGERKTEPQGGPPNMQEVVSLLSDGGLVERLEVREPDGTVVAHEWAAPFDIDLVSSILSGEKTTQDLSLSELSSVAMFLGAMLADARARHEAEIAVGNLRGEALKQRLLAELQEGVKRGFKEDTSRAKFMEFLKAQFLDPEWLFYELGNGKVDSAWYGLMHEFKKGFTIQHALEETVLRRLDDAFSRYKEEFKRDWRVSAAVFGGDPNHFLNRNEFRMVVLNMASEGNRERLLNGYGWDEGLVLDYIRENLTDGEAELIRGIQEAISSIRPFADQLHREYYGVPMGVVRGLPIEYGDGKVLQGRYFPVMWRFKEEVGNRPAWDVGSVRRGALNIETNDSYTKARAKKTKARPINLDIRRIHSWLGGVIRDVSHRRNLDTLFNIVTDQGIARAITEKIGGPDVFTGNVDPSIRTGPTGAARDILNGLFEGVAYGDVGPGGADNISARAMQQFKLLYAANALGLNIRNLVEDQTNYVLGAVRGKYRLSELQPFAQVKGKLKGVARRLTEPLRRGRMLERDAIAEAFIQAADDASWERMRERVLHLSNSVRTREKGITSALADLVGEGEGIVHKMARHAFAVHRLSDRIQATLIFDAAFRTAMKRMKRDVVEGKITPQDAIRLAAKYGDHAVDTVLPPVEAAFRPRALRRKSPLAPFMLFQSYFLRQFSASARDAGDLRRAVAEGKYRAAAWKALRLAMVFAIMGPVNQWLIGRGPDEENDEDYGRFIVRSLLQGAGQNFVPVFGSEAGGLAFFGGERLLLGDEAVSTLHDLNVSNRSSAWGSFFERTFRIMDDMAKAYEEEGEINDEFLKAAARVILEDIAPAGTQLRRTLRAIEEDGTPLEVFFGPAKGGLPKEIGE